MSRKVADIVLKVAYREPEGDDFLKLSDHVKVATVIEKNQARNAPTLRLLTEALVDL